MSKLLVAIIVFGLQINYLTAIEQICSPAGQCYTFSEEEGSKIILIGNIHTKEAIKFESQLSREALKKNVVYLHESFDEDKASMTIIAHCMGYTDPGYLLGIENGLANIFSDLVFRYIWIYAAITFPEQEWPAHMLESTRTGREELLSAFQARIATQGFWREFKKSEDRKNLSENIISIIDDLIDSREMLEKARLEAYQKLSVDDNQWLDLFKYFGLYILENHVTKLPKDKQLDIELIRNFLLEKPLKNENMLYVRYNVNTYWRNIFIKENIKKSFAFAKKVKKPLFIIIGQDHYNDIESFIKSEGYPLESYPSSPEDIMDEEETRKWVENSEL